MPPPEILFHPPVLYSRPTPYLLTLAVVLSRLVILEHEHVRFDSVHTHCTSAMRPDGGRIPASVRLPRRRQQPPPLPPPPLPPHPTLTAAQPLPRLASSSSSQPSTSSSSSAIFTIGDDADDDVVAENESKHAIDLFAPSSSLSRPSSAPSSSLSASTSSHDLFATLQANFDDDDDDDWDDGMDGGGGGASSESVSDIGSDELMQRGAQAVLVLHDVFGPTWVVNTQLVHIYIYISICLLSCFAQLYVSSRD